MKRTVVLVMMLVMTGAAPLWAARRVRATYRTFAGREVTREWRVEETGTQARFYLEGRLRATAFLKDGVIVRLVLKKRHAGVWKEMVITGPAAIRMELQSGFYPFDVLSSRAASRRRWRTGSARFELVPEGAEQ